MFTVPLTSHMWVSSFLAEILMIDWVVGSVVTLRDNDVGYETSFIWK